MAFVGELLMGPDTSALRAALSFQSLAQSPSTEFQFSSLPKLRRLRWGLLSLIAALLAKQGLPVLLDLNSSSWFSRREFVPLLLFVPHLLEAAAVIWIASASELAPKQSCWLGTAARFFALAGLLVAMSRIIWPPSVCNCLGPHFNFHPADSFTFCRPLALVLIWVYLANQLRRQDEIGLCRAAGLAAILYGIAEFTYSIGTWADLLLPSGHMVNEKLLGLFTLIASNLCWYGVGYICCLIMVLAALAFLRRIQRELPVFSLGNQGLS